MKRVIIGATLATVMLLTICGTRASAEKNFQTGDVIFQTTRGRLATVVATATASKYTHVGMVIVKNGKPYVIEARNRGVKMRPLHKFTEAGFGKNFSVLRINYGLSDEEKRKLANEARSHLGKKYDSKFRWDDKKLYCSELVYKSYKNALGLELNTTEKLGDFYSTWNPIINAYVERKYGNGKKLPLEEAVISPVRLYESNKLKLIHSTYLVP
jgi:hypothetical protein